jgi:translation initiation factor eIF-2B subunit delta/methylthioribose-1-phosphate isomerase
MDAAVAARVRLISEDREHGAGWLARQAVEALGEAVQAGADPLEAARALAGARPAMAAVAGAVGRVLAAGKTDEQLLEQCTALIERRDRAAHSIAALLRPDLDGTVMTHSASATVREALVYAQPPRVVCTVTEPGEEGRPFAQDLTEAGLAVELVADEDAAHALETVDLLLLGADSVFRDGSLVNRGGTSALCDAAREVQVPVVVACETFKLAPFDPDEAAADEEPFDLTPPDVIDRYVTDEGVFTPDEIAALIDQTPFLREGYELLRSTRAG